MSIRALIKKLFISFYSIKLKYFLTLKRIEGILLDSRSCYMLFCQPVSSLETWLLRNNKDRRRVAFPRTTDLIMASLSKAIKRNALVVLCFVLEDEEKRKARAPHFIFQLCHVEVRLRSSRNLTFRRGLSL